MEEQKRVSLTPIQNSACKIVITKELQEKIDYTCAALYDREWSGTLFYNIEGGFETDDLVVRAIDFLLEDIGGKVTTEFSTSPDVITYLCDHNMVGVKQGLIHSHHNMETFFSGTDQDTLLAEGQDKVHFVSLIVNNKKKYNAAITRKVQKEVKSTCTYTTYDGTVKTYSKTEVTEGIEYAPLNVTMEMGENISELMDRINELKERAKTQESPVILGTEQDERYYETPKWGSMSVSDRWDEGSSVRQEELFEEDPEKIDYNNLKVDKDVVDTIVRQMITGCVLTNLTSKVDINKIAVGMYEPYKKRFNNNMQMFKDWAEPYVEFLIYNAPVSNLGTNDVDVIISAIAYHVSKALLAFPQNIYMKTYVDLVEQYII